MPFQQAAVVISAVSGQCCIAAVRLIGWLLDGIPGYGSEGMKYEAPFLSEAPCRAAVVLSARAKRVQATDSMFFLLLMFRLAGLSASWDNCSSVFRFSWFTLAFVMVVLLGLLITTVTHLGLHFSRPFWVGMLAISALLMMIASESFFGIGKMDKYGANEPGWWRVRWRTATAGAIMTVVYLILLMMAVGTE